MEFANLYNENEIHSILELLKEVVGCDITQFFRILSGRKFHDDGFVFGHYCRSIDGNEYISVDFQIGVIDESLFFDEGRSMRFPKGGLVDYTTGTWDYYIIYFDDDIPLAAINLERAWRGDILIKFNQDIFPGTKDITVSREELNTPAYQNPLGYTMTDPSTKLYAAYRNPSGYAMTDV